MLSNDFDAHPFLFKVTRKTSYADEEYDSGAYEYTYKVDKGDLVDEHQHIFTEDSVPALESPEEIEKEEEEELVEEAREGEREFVLFSEG